MLTLKKVAVTGNLAAGKSTACRLLGELGATVLSADEITHALYHPETPLGEKIIGLLGQEVVVDGAFDRKKIAAMVFADLKKLQQLEKILHPEVQKIVEKRYRQLLAHHLTAPLVVEVPLLYESDLDTHYDYVIAVVATPSLCEERFKKRGGTSEEFHKRSIRLMPADEKAAKADWKVTNDGTMEELKKQLKEIYKQLI